MPGGGKGGFGNSSVTITEKLPNESVTVTDNNNNVRQYRNRPKKERPVRKTYSFYPSTVRALEMYADDNGMSYSQVINLALRQLIPKTYYDLD